MLRSSLNTDVKNLCLVHQPVNLMLYVFLLSIKAYYGFILGLFKAAYSEKISSVA